MAYNPVFTNGAQAPAFNGANSFFKPSTDGCVLFSGDKMLKISYFDTSMKFEIRTKNPDPNANPKYIKPKEGEEIAIVLTAERVAQMCKALEKFNDKIIELQDAHNRHEEPSTDSYSVGVVTSNTVGAAKVFEISTGIAGPAGYQPEIRLYLGIGEDKKPTRSDVFKTQTGNVLINYNGGDTETEIFDEMPQYVLILNIFNTFVENFGHAALHFSKTKASNDMTHMVDVIDRIAMQVGVPVKQQMRTGNDYGQANRSGSVSSAPVQYTNTDLASVMDLPY